MTRLYASIALLALVMMAAPTVKRVVGRAVDRASAIAGERWAAGETIGEIEVDVVGCIAEDISQGESR